MPLPPRPLAVLALVALAACGRRAPQPDLLVVVTAGSGSSAARQALVERGTVTNGPLVLPWLADPARATDGERLAAALAALLAGRTPEAVPAPGDLAAAFHAGGYRTLCVVEGAPAWRGTAGEGADVAWSEGVLRAADGRGASELLTEGVAAVDRHYAELGIERAPLLVLAALGAEDPDGARVALVLEAAAAAGVADGNVLLLDTGPEDLWRLALAGPGLPEGARSGPVDPRGLFARLAEVGRVPPPSTLKNNTLLGTGPLGARE